MTPFRQRESLELKTSELDKSGLRIQSSVEEDLGQVLIFAYIKRYRC